MQKDTEVGRIATAVPVIISRALEMFLKSFLMKTSQITQSKHSRVMSIAHMKQCIESEKLFDFLKDLAEQATTPSAQIEVRTRGTWPTHRKKWKDLSVKGKQFGTTERSRRTNTDPFEDMEHLDVGNLFNLKVGQVYICTEACDFYCSQNITEIYCLRTH
ncbi:dr1-associated corepressor isoform X2 [Scleropages formosus]|uniref:Dr1-associated corepressor-like n=3 Tax=Scleropages formosus TaxID=113540 RepID=A0A8C9RYU0_SCLFO|nr:dr1-associated corepressor-like isoform X2 [Scleropages formosus]